MMKFEITEDERWSLHNYLVTAKLEYLESAAKLDIAAQEASKSKHAIMSPESCKHLAEGMRQQAADVDRMLTKLMVQHDEQAAA